MDQALIQVGLPVKCAYGDCGVTSFVKPHNYGGWYKSRLMRFKRKKWFCPAHAKKGEDIDNRFYQTYATPVEKVELKDSTEEELYKLLED